MKAVLLFVFMPWADAGCTCKYLSTALLMRTECSCGEWTDSTCGFWTDCNKISNQDDCASAENVDGQQFCKWEEPETQSETCDKALASARRGLEDAVAERDDAVARFENVAKYFTAVIRGECLADGGSCDECCHGITGRCQKLTVDGGGWRNQRITDLTDDDDCVLIEGRFNKIYVTFPRLKLPRLFFHPRGA